MNNLHQEQPVIAVRDVVKCFPLHNSELRVLDGINLDVHRGEMVMLMGPSGSGKTTLLSIMGCILRATSGSIRVCGEEVLGLPERALPRLRLAHFGFVFQGFNLFPALSVGQNVELALDLKGVRGRSVQLKAAEILDTLGLGAKLAAYPADLSGGQKQRVAIARALAGDPAIILADEPTAALDSASGRTVMETFRDLAHQRGRAVVIVTHDTRTLEYADRIVQIEDGRIGTESRPAAQLLGVA